MVTYRSPGIGAMIEIRGSCAAVVKVDRTVCIDRLDGGIERLNEGSTVG